jgi:hypothetical protein
LVIARVVAIARVVCDVRIVNARSIVIDGGIARPQTVASFP